ncbi:hypothetical protein [Armatimonas sp.]|uniref:hypothetical protein n=1 Tax=Armatimonas sp. TaxID=1872638 RepID=UPI00374DAD38
MRLPKWKPISFTTESIQALRAGTKTQTRRILKIRGTLPEFGGYSGEESDLSIWEFPGLGLGPEGEEALTLEDLAEWKRCQYGRAGDFLWVKETWAISGVYKNPTGGDPLPRYEYKAFPADGTDFRSVSRWKSPRYMPRAASRLSYQLADVRIQRLHDITFVDAVAEGVPSSYGEAVKLWGQAFLRGRASHVWDNFTSVENYAWLWDKINGKGSWERNDWVAALTLAPVPAESEAPHV